MITSSGCRNRWSINNFIMVVSEKKIFSHALPGADPGFGQAGAQVLRLKFANVAKQSCTSKASNLWL